MDNAVLNFPTVDPADDDDAPVPDKSAARHDPMHSPRFVAISRSLQRIFGNIVEQPLPERLAELIHQVDHLVLRRKDTR